MAFTLTPFSSLFPNSLFPLQISTKSRLCNPGLSVATVSFHLSELSQQIPLFSKLPPRASGADVPDFLPATWVVSWEKKPIGPRLNLTAEEAVRCQLDALKYNNEPHPDHGVEVMYKFASFDPFERSKYFGPVLDLGQFERFRRIFHHSAYRALLSHKERKILSSLYVTENCFKQRIWTKGSRPDEEEIFEFTMIQRIGGFWDGYWVTESLLHDGEGLSGGIAY
eukprot:TRINITY_DN25034_c0_g1_i1.p1 TRINITY_DN25034_c0_g1~~TRINITY_DN25034_c0_g1_i1.p1  ORF type:complete len:224 (-),score=31.08 TRINITY_DN25034_c0_g1_i1:614-1285(-)